MSALKFLTRIASGTVQLVTAITSSTGGADGNKVIATQPDGTIDPSFFPPGVTIHTEIVNATEALVAGDFVNIYDNGGAAGVRKAIANDPAKFANGFVLDAFTISTNATVYTGGINTTVAATEGIRSYLSTTVAGSSTETAPTDTPGHIQQVLGTGVATGLLFEFDDYIEFT